MKRNSNVMVISLLVVCGSAFAQDEIQFPYQALVTSDDTEVRSGPGLVHYATDRLEQGDVVEVYRHDPGEWCAIRPVPGSFSLVPESAVDKIVDGVGEIETDGAQAWVGTHLGPVDRPLWQVKLRAGEKVEVLGQVSWPSEEGHSTIWYQISPPAGEFRWIQLSDLQMPDGATKLPDEAIDFEIAESDSAANRVNAIRRANFESQADSGVKLQEIGSHINSGWRRATRSSKIAANKTGAGQSSRPGEGQQFTPPSLPVNRTAPKGSGPIERLAMADDFEPATLGNMLSEPIRIPDAPQLSPTPTGRLTNRIHELELLLTDEMLKPPGEWHLTDLIPQAEAIRATPADSIERQQAEALLAKLLRCQNIRSGHQAAYAEKPVGIGVESDKQRSSDDLDSEIYYGTTYDAYGWLDKLVRDGGSLESTFVLKDENDKITHHITPAPGVNLHRYVKSKIGIIGQRGYHQKLNLDHVTAERIVILEQR